MNISLIQNRPILEQDGKFSYFCNTARWYADVFLPQTKVSGHSAVEMKPILIKEILLDSQDQRNVQSQIFFSIQFLNFNQISVRLFN